MIKRILLISGLILVFCTLSAQTFEWGARYLGGVSSIFGANDSYILQYDLDVSGVHHARLSTQSEAAHWRYSQGAGLYFMKRISKGVDSIWLQPELLWKRHSYGYDFDNSLIDLDNPAIAASFPSQIQGSIDHTVDYLSIPLLIKMRQDIPEDRHNDQFQGAYIYFGPAYSALLNHKQSTSEGAADLANEVYNYLTANPGMDFEQFENASDTLVSHSLDVVVGMGFQLQDVFKVGLRKDTFSFDIRGDMSVFTSGDSEQRNNFRLYSVMLSLGYRL